MELFFHEHIFEVEDMNLVLLIILGGLIPNVLCESIKGSYEQVIVFSCQSAINTFKFGCDGSPFKCLCNYEPKIGSLIKCVDQYLPKYEGDFSKSTDQIIKSCYDNAGIVLTKEKITDVLQNATKFLINPEVGKDEVLYVPVLPLENIVRSKVRDYRAFLGNIDLSQTYGVIINLFWVCCLIWFGIFNKIKSNKRLNSKLKNSKIDYLRSKISLPLIFKHHFHPYRYFFNLTCLLPTNAETMVLFIYLTLNSVYLSINYDLYPTNSLFGSDIYSQAYRYIADRSGILSFAHFPLLVLFAGRNNLLISISGLSYSTFMIFHKWTARIMFLNAAIHSIAYSLIILEQNKFRAYLTKEWFIFGFVAFFTSLSLIFFAIHNFRIKYYEVFLITHIIFALLFFISCYAHCLEFGWLEWVYGALIFWLVDRILRVFKLIRFGAPIAKIQFISDETFKVSVKRPSYWKPYPGCFVFIHFLHPSIFWQSHPFTIMDSVINEDEVTIYIKAKEGLTKKVLKIIGHKPGNSINMRVSLEGPYGNQSPVDGFDNIILIAGGNGIPGPFYHAIHLGHTNLLPKQRIRLIWIIRRIDSLKWFENELELLKDSNIECDIYITRNFDKIKNDESKLINKFSSFINFHSGRAPNHKILLDEFKNAQGTIGIVTCGPNIMCDDVRDFVGRNLQKCRFRVDLFEELQVW